MSNFEIANGIHFSSPLGISQYYYRSECNGRQNGQENCLLVYAQPSPLCPLIVCIALHHYCIHLLNNVQNIAVYSMIFSSTKLSDH